VTPLTIDAATSAARRIEVRANDCSDRSDFFAKRRQTQNRNDLWR
jgi:hypothetical protein